MPRAPVTWRAILLLGAYVVVFPPLFVLGPLAGLLVASRPRTLREWAWIGAAALWLVVGLWQPGGLAEQMLHAWALFVTAAFVALMLSGRVALVPGALLSTVFGLGAATAWTWWLGSRWQEVQLAVAHSGWEFCRQLLEEARNSTRSLHAVQVYAAALGDGVAVLAQLFPGVLVVTALPGLALAWAWYHRIAARPAGRPAPPFGRFTFSDQMVWLVVACLVVMVLPLPGPVNDLAANLAVVVGGLYAARGAAVLSGTVEGFPLPVMILILIGVFLFLPVAVGGAFALGLADTWVDFRHRFSAAGQHGE